MVEENASLFTGPILNFNTYIGFLDAIKVIKTDYVLGNTVSE